MTDEADSLIELTDRLMTQSRKNTVEYIYDTQKPKHMGNYVIIRRKTE